MLYGSVCRRVGDQFRDHSGERRTDEICSENAGVSAMLGRSPLWENTEAGVAGGHLMILEAA